MSPPLAALRAVVINALAVFSSCGVCAAAQITSDSIWVGLLGNYTQYQITANNHPTSFDATNLPPGLSLDRTTGLISGVLSVSGSHYTHITAHGPSDDAVGGCDFIVYLPTPETDPTAGGFGAECIRLIADPNRPRLYCGTANQELVVIDTETRNYLAVIPGIGNAKDLCISADGQSLWYLRAYYYNSLARVSLEAPANGFTALTTSGSFFKVAEGLDNRLYVSRGGIEILQLDALTGATQQSFRPNDVLAVQGMTLAISVDRRTLYVSDTFRTAPNVYPTHSAISRYDISTSTPVLLQRVEMPSPGISGIRVTPDGNSIFVAVGAGYDLDNNAIKRALRLAAHDLSVTTGVLSYRGNTATPLSLSADGTRALQPVHLLDGGSLMTGLVHIFDTQTFQLLKTVVLGTSEFVYVGDAVLDRTGSWLFASTDRNPKLRIYPAPTPTPPPVTPPKSLLNIATRMLTQTGDNVLIGGFIVTGSESKQVILRGIAPSLPMPGKLADPVLELHGPGGSIVAENDNWNSHRNEVIATGIPPSEEREAAIVTTLQPGAYTAVLSGFAGTTGIAAVEVYDLNASANSRLANISTRGKVETGDNVMIGGWIIGGGDPTKVAIRAIGPSLAGSGVNDPLADPTLDVHNGNGTLIAQNDDWRTSQEQALIGAGLAPSNDREAAILLTLTPGNYTGIIRGKDVTTGVALVEVYNLQ